MRTAFWISGLFFILLFSPVHAQQVAETNSILDPIWDAINGILATLDSYRDKIGKIKLKLETHIDEDANFADSVNAAILSLQQFDAFLQNQISATNVTVQENTDTLIAHSQQINDLNNITIGLNQTDFSLQTQINDNNDNFNSYTAQTDVHLQILEANDANLQTQINGITNGSVNRNNVYFVANTSPVESTAFCADNTDILLFGYCSGKTMGDVYYPETALYDDFEDFDFTFNPTWQVVYGNLGVGTSGTLMGKLFTIPNYGEISTPVDITATQISMSSKLRTHGGNTSEFGLALTDKEGPWGMSNDDGYLLYTRVNGSSSSFSFAKLVNGTGSDIYNSPTMTLNPYTDYVTKAERDESGYWRFYIDGVQSGPAVFDNTYQTFSYTHILLNGPFAVADDINISSSGYSAPSSSAVLNIYDYNAPMGVECSVNGSARALCLRVD